MAKGSVRKKGKKWYYRFYVEDQSGNLVQKEYAGTESKSETEKLLRQAMDDYENKRFVAKTDNLTVGDLLNKHFYYCCYSLIFWQDYNLLPNKSLIL